MRISVTSHPWVRNVFSARHGPPRAPPNPRAMQPLAPLREATGVCPCWAQGWAGAGLHPSAGCWALDVAGFALTEGPVSPGWPVCGGRLVWAWGCTPQRVCSLQVLAPSIPVRTQCMKQLRGMLRVSPRAACWCIWGHLLLLQKKDVESSASAWHPWGCRWLIICATVSQGGASAAAPGASEV